MEHGFPLRDIYLQDHNTMKTFTASLYGIGDSVTAGTGASGASTRYINILSTNKSFTLTNEGVGSTEIIQHSIKCFGHYNASNPVKNKDQFVFLSGYNDMRKYGNNANHIQYFYDTLMSNAVWCSVQDRFKIYGQDTKNLITYTGSWSNESTYTGIGKTSSTLNDTASFTVYGSVVYICSLAVSGGSGKISVSVDGVSQGTFNCYDSDASHTGTSVSNHPFIIRIAGLSVSKHTVVVTVAQNGGATAFYFATGNGGLYPGCEVKKSCSPDVYIGTLMYMTATGYSSYSPLNNGSDSAVDAYNNKIALVVDTLSGDGLYVYKVDVNKYFIPSASTFDVDLVHPNDAGHAQIASAFVDMVTNATKRSYLA